MAFSRGSSAALNIVAYGLAEKGGDIKQDKKSNRFGKRVYSPDEGGESGVRTTRLCERPMGWNYGSIARKEEEERLDSNANPGYVKP